MTCRAVPWARLSLESRHLLNDLNLRRDQRLSSALVAVAAVRPCYSFPSSRAIVLPVAALLAVIGLNRRLYAFLLRRGGLSFAAASLLLHWLYCLMVGWRIWPSGPASGSGLSSGASGADDTTTVRKGISMTKESEPETLVVGGSGTYGQREARPTRLRSAMVDPRPAFRIRGGEGQVGGASVSSFMESVRASRFVWLRGEASRVPGCQHQEGMAPREPATEVPEVQGLAAHDEPFQGAQQPAARRADGEPGSPP